MTVIAVLVVCRLYQPSCVFSMSERGSVQSLLSPLLPFASEVGPSLRVWVRVVSAPVEPRVDPQPKLNLVLVYLKNWHLVVTIFNDFYWYSADQIFCRVTPGFQRSIAVSVKKYVRNTFIRIRIP